MALEISSAKRERDFYLKQVDQGKAFVAMTERRQKRASEARALPHSRTPVIPHSTHALPHSRGFRV